MAKIEIKGPIIPDGHQKIYDYFGMPATSPSKINSVLSAARDGEEMELVINSPGGITFSGSEIYTALKSYTGKVTAKVVGVAASAASFIAMAADRIEMSPTAQMMIHRGSVAAAGNKHDFEHIADVLSGIDESIATAYQMRTGIKTTDLLDMMSKETWLNAMKAKELGFADAIMFEDEIVATNSLTDSGGLLPDAVIDKMRMQLAGEPVPKPEPKAEQPEEPQPNNKLQIAKAKAEAVLFMSNIE